MVADRLLNAVRVLAHSDTAPIVTISLSFARPDAPPRQMIAPDFSNWPAMRRRTKAGGDQAKLFEYQLAGATQEG